ncbi:thiamine-phosphate pyrophosphorylase 2 [Candidatus Moduliflexus flocculans]|uniref:Thiamine-phosphate synthase n=1 Tax=Candidatus Moduliflexus flocculans TaxID=1499966 RepID=A0A081BPB8_9BACT|nr:thiamine-phosphate pyrophosphorylase 2 [Candidatus Moduliflexus flocculans]
MKNTQIHGIYFVTDRELLKGKSLEETVLHAVQGGVSLVQLREKTLPTRAFIATAQRLKTALKPYHVPLIINDRIDVALAAEADGVHIGQDDMPYPLARKLLGAQAIIGVSVENMEQVLEAEAWEVDYLGVSAIFATPTKTDIKRAWGLDGLREVKRRSRHPLVAIGGIHSDNAADVMQAGADSIAVVSAICAANDPLGATQQLLQAISFPVMQFGATGGI